MTEGDGRRPRDRAGALVLLSCVLVGAALRARGLGSQIPIDDEWHGLDFALSRGFGFLFTHFSRAGANSIVYNLYLRAALVTVGWTELTIVLPSLLAGVGLLWVFPRFVWRRFGMEAGLVSSLALGISPFLIFYSRTARIYATLLLLECLALLALVEWLRGGRRRHAIAFVGWGALAIWSHASALAPMAAAMAAVAVHRGLLARRGVGLAGPRARAVLAAGAAMLALAGALWLPGLLGALPSPEHAPARFSWRTFAGLFEMWIGTANPVLAVLCLAALGVGVRLAARRAREEVIVLLAAIVGGLLSVLAARPNLAGVGLVLARYLLPGFLLVSLALGVVAQAMIRGAPTTVGRNLRFGGVFAVLALLYVLGPLPRIHGQVNSFTKHPAFQASYGEPDPTRALPDPLDDGSTKPVERARLQPFYGALARTFGRAPIIEYPFLLGEDVNLLYFAQQLHGRPVLAGTYASGAGERDVFGIAVSPRRPGEPAPPSPGFVTNAMMIDHVLARGEKDPRVRFRTVVDILDPVAVERSGAEFLVLHGNLLRELFELGPEGMGSEFVLRIERQLADRYGMPVFENELVTVLRLR